MSDAATYQSILDAVPQAIAWKDGSGRCAACIPSTCAPNACGSVPDGCGGTLSCGGCLGNSLCDAGGSGDARGAAGGSELTRTVPVSKTAQQATRTHGDALHAMAAGAGFDWLGGASLRGANYKKTRPRRNPFFGRCDEQHE